MIICFKTELMVKIQVLQQISRTFCVLICYSFQAFSQVCSLQLKGSKVLSTYLELQNKVSVPESRPVQSFTRVKKRIQCKSCHLIRYILMTLSCKLKCFLTSRMSTQCKTRTLGIADFYKVAVTCLKLFFYFRLRYLP